MPYILIAILSVWFVQVTQIPTYIAKFLCGRGWYFRSYYGDKIPKRIKPLDCEYCLSFWFALGYGVATGSIQDAIINAALTSFAAYIISLLINKIK